MRLPMRQRILLGCVPLVVALLAWTSIFRHARDGVADLLFDFRYTPNDVVVIAIDEHSIQTIGQWPWPRAVMASAISRLSSARAIGIDVNYKESSRLGISDDRALVTALRTSRVPVVLASELQPDNTIIGPIPTLTVVSHQGLANMTVDADGVARTVSLWRTGIPTFATQIAQVATGRQDSSLPTHIRIRYVGPERTIPTYPFTNLLDGTIPASDLKDKIILIGATARDLQDYRQTPLGLMSGVEVQATIVENILHNDFLQTRPVVDILVTLLAGIAGLAVAWYLRRILTVLMGTGLAIVLVWIGVFIAFNHGLIIDIIMPTVAIIIGASAMMLVRYLATTQERRFIHDTFSRYLAPQVIEALIEDPSRIRIGGERRELTILFSDIRGFTTLSETMGPQELAQFLNRYLGIMTDLILTRRGVIDKYIGDAIMAFWGAPLDDDEHALHGVLSALSMVSGLEEFNAENQTLGLAKIDVGIGLNTGTVTVGNMGSEKRFDYTVIGDEVNLASRLESLTKTYGVNIIVSENVLSAITLEDRTAHEIVSREIDRVRVKGKHQPVTIFEILAPAKATRLKPHMETFASALAHYYAGHWSDAINVLETFLSRIEHDGPARLLLERCREFVNDAPINWDGAFEMKHK